MPETQPPVVDDQLAAILEGLKGRWVAIHERQVVADGESAEEVVKLARERGVTDPTVFRVSTHPNRLSFF